MNLIKATLIILGTISLSLGIMGIAVPGLPTTPFLLLTAGLYIRSSERLYNRLINNRVLGGYIKGFRTNGGMSRKMKVYSICMMWAMIGTSCLFIITIFSVKLIVVGLGLTGTLVMGLIVPTIKNSGNSNH